MKSLSGLLKTALITTLLGLTSTQLYSKKIEKNSMVPIKSVHFKTYLPKSFKDYLKLDLKKKKIKSISNSFLQSTVSDIYLKEKHFLPIRKEENARVNLALSETLRENLQIDKIIEKGFYNLHPKFGEVFFKQTKDVYAIGALDSFLKGNKQSGDLEINNFWKAQGNFLGYGNLMWITQFGSALEYGLKRGEGFTEKLRYFLGRAAISSIGEHLGYWYHSQLSGVAIKDWKREGDIVFNLENGPRYPQDPINWMKPSPAGWLAKLRNNKGDVERADIFAAMGLAYAFSYLITPTPDGPMEESDTTMFNLKPYFYFNNTSNEWNLGFPHVNGVRAGLEYKIPDDVDDYDSSILMYQNSDLNPIMEFKTGNSTLEYRFGAGIKRKLDGKKFTPFFDKFSITTNSKNKGPIRASLNFYVQEKAGYFSLGLDLDRI